MDRQDVELVLDACDAASEKTEEEEEDAEEERVVAYGWVSGNRPKLGGRISSVMLTKGIQKVVPGKERWTNKE